MYNTEENEHENQADAADISEIISDETEPAEEVVQQGDDIEIREGCEGENESEASEVEALESTEEEEREALSRLFPELKNSALSQRYRELRALGLTPEEAYLATCPRRQPSQIHDTRSHLSDSVPRSSSTPQALMTRRELREAREIFSGLDDSQIISLYKRVTQ